MAEQEQGGKEKRKKPDDEDVNPQSETNKKLREQTEAILGVSEALGVAVTEQKNAAATPGSAAEKAVESIKNAEENAKRKIDEITDEITDPNKKSKTENETGPSSENEQLPNTKQISSSINTLVKIPVKIPVIKSVINPVTIPVAQQYEVEMAKFYARKKAKELEEFADNLERHQESIITAAADIAEYQARVCKDPNAINLPKVLQTVVAAKELILKEKILNKSPSVKKLLLNIVDLHNTKNTPIEIQNLCQAIGKEIIKAPTTTFSVQEKVQLTDFVLMIRDTMSLMSDETLPIIQRYAKSIQNSSEYQHYSRAEQRAIDVLAPTFRCCSAFTNWITHLPQAISSSKAYKVTKTAIEWGFNPGTVASLGSWLNQEAVIDSVRNGGLLPDTYPTEYLSFKLAFILSTLVFGSSIYFYYLKKFREDQAKLPTVSRSEPVNGSSNDPELSTEPGSAKVAEDHPLKLDQDVYEFSNFLQDVRKDYFPNIEERAEKQKISMKKINEFGSMKHRVEAAVSEHGEFSQDVEEVASKRKPQSQNNQPIGPRRVRQIGTNDPQAKSLIQGILESAGQPAPQQEGAAAAADSHPQEQDLQPRLELSFANFGRAANIYVTADSKITPECAAAADAASELAATARNATQGSTSGKMSFRRMRKSVSKSKRKSLRKSKRKSARKSVRKTVKKSAKKPLRKSVKKSLRKSPRKPLKKSVRKSLRKSPRKPLKKSVRKSLRKSKRKSLRKSLRKPVKKSIRKSTSKNRQMKKSR
jgi:hypothetical protein